MTERENKGRQTGLLTHSHSTPAGVDGGGVGCGSKTPPTTPKKGGKMLAVRVQMLDDTVTMFQIQAKALGKVLFEQVCRQLNLLEADYFGLEYTDAANIRYWIDMEKPLTRQAGLSMVETFLRFGVKFYTPDPAQLEEEFTRYLYCLQIKRDLRNGDLHCNDNTAAVMASFIVQAECGDYNQEDYPDHSYLSTYKFVPNQDHELERRIMENHKKLEGQIPAQADLNLLDTARKCELYGIKLHSTKDHEGVPLNLAVAHKGILVFQNYTNINTFSWAKIRKISFKRKKFLIKLHPESNVYYKDTVEFFFDGRDECKNFWKKCVEHHGFFRCSTVKKIPRQKTRVLSRGSSFRYSGRTQKQIVDYVRDNYVKREPFQRSYSVRHSASAHTSVSNVNTSISAQPLLPLSDQALSTPASHSCGSMTLSSRGDPNSPSAQIHDFDTRDLDTPSLPTSRQETLSQPTSVTSSPQRYTDRLTDDELSPSPQRVPPPSESKPSTEISSPTEISIPGSPPPAYQSHEPVVNGHVTPREIQVVTVHPIQESTPTISTSPPPVKTIEVEPEVRRKRYPTDKAYFIAKEILMTERTYKKDLEVINVWFREDISKEEGMPKEVLTELYQLIDPLYDLHCSLLRDIETRLSTWEGKGNAHLKGDYQRIGDVFRRQGTMMEQLYSRYVSTHLTILEALDTSFRRCRKFENFYKDFEVQKVCYLPFTSFLLKPLHRLLHYQLLLQRLTEHYGKEHQDFNDCWNTLTWLNTLCPNVQDSLSVSENFVKLVELQRDLIGFDSLVQPKRRFIREGCLQKFSRKSYQQRIFFLFSDVLVYCNRSTNPTLQFKVHGTIPLRNVHMVEENIGQSATPNCFTIYGGNRAIVVAASSPEEKSKWLKDLHEAIAEAKEPSEDENIQASYLSLKSCSSSDEVLNTSGLEDNVAPRPAEKPAQQRSNTTVHVCWHRNTSLSISDLNASVKNQLSGYLLRKFKNSNGWQKLWVVCTNFCLFFYKNFQDEFPLASLPLLGYTAGTPTEKDSINKDYVFKLQFKNHVYFFRAESEYTFERWMEVINNATQNTVKRD